MVKPLDTRWTRHISDEQGRKDFEALVRNSTILLRRLNELLTERERDLNVRSFSEDDFKDPNWSHKIAARLARLAEIKSLKDLIQLT